MPALQQNREFDAIWTFVWQGLDRERLQWRIRRFEMNKHGVRILMLVAAAALWLAFVPAATAQSQDRAEVALKAAIDKEVVDGDLKGAIEQYKKIVAQPGAGRATVATALLRMGQCHEKLGNAEARTAYQRLVRDFADQAEIVAQARMRLAALGGPGGGGALVTRRVLTDASGVGEVLTPDGKYIRDIDWKTGDVVQFEVASGQRSRITNRGPWGEGENWYEYQLFSRDGKQIVYASYTKEKEWALQLRIRNLDGSGLRTLYSEEGSYVRLFDWSPDGGSILAILERKPNNYTDELTLISTADGSVRVLRSIASAWYTLKRARFSPDGRFVAYSLVREGSPPHGDVFLMTADGRNEVVVAGHPAEDQLLGWTPDGRSLVFLSDRSGTWDIWSVHITGGKQQGEPELLKKNFGWDSEVLGFAPDGSLYYKTYTALCRLYNAVVDLETGKVLD
ncbi:MAG: tetratricopeptide repeat protein, partial [Acidobacteria bacterium]|nr:tetratricopeptide repeat protein [Acidobacteriota bacterium]